MLQIACEKKFQIEQHVKTSSHIAKVEKLKSGGKVQSSLSKCFLSKDKVELNEQQEFNRDLCRAMVASNIPLSKLSNENFSSFLQKYCKYNVPSERTSRRNDVNCLYSSVMEEIKQKIGKNYFYICMDESTDSMGRYIAHLMVGVLSEKVLPKSYLIASKQLEKTNALAVARFIQEELAAFFLPEAVPTDHLLLLLSDAAPYMVKAGNNLKIFYKNLIHVTCLAHGLNRVAEEIRKKFPLVNTLISSVKKVFIKAPTRVQFFKERLPNISLPPQPVLTRWGTWLEAAIYYADNFSQIKELISDLTDNSSQSLLEAKEACENKQIKQQLSFIKSNYSFVSKYLTQLEASSLPITESVQLIKHSESAFKSVKGETGEHIFEKFKSVLTKNNGYQFISKVAHTLMGNFDDSVDIDLDPKIIASLKNAPITSVDVERSFSIYKYMYSDRRHTFLLENFQQHLIVYSFYNC